MKTKEIYNRLRVNYRLTSLILSGANFFIFLFLASKIEFSSSDEYDSFVLISAAMSILIGYEYAIIKYFFSGIHPLFEKLRPLFQNNEYQGFSQNLKNRLDKSWIYRLTIIAVMMPFIILELITVREISPFYYTYNRTLCSLILDITNHISGYLILFLLAVFIWIVIELTLIVNDLKGKYSLKINVFDTDELGGLKPLRFFSVLIAGSYFIIITLAVISYIDSSIDPEAFPRISPKAILTSEIIVLSLMVPIGVILFITTQETIRKLIDKGVKLELERINRKYKEICDKAVGISSNEKNSDRKKELEELRIILDILEKEEIKVKRIKHKTFDVRTIITFTTTVLFPIVTTINKIIELMDYNKL